MLFGVGTARDFAIVIGPGTVDAGPDGPAVKAGLFGVEVDQIVAYRVIHLRGDLDRNQIEELVDRLLVDPVNQWWMYRREHLPPSGHGQVSIVETGLRPGVTDEKGPSCCVRQVELGLPLEAATVATRWMIYGDLDGGQLTSNWPIGCCTTR